MEYLKILEVLLLVLALQITVMVDARPTVNYLNLTNDTSTAVDMQDNVIVVSIQTVPSMVCGSVDGKTGQFRLTALCHGKAGERENGCRPAEEVEGGAEEEGKKETVAEEEEKREKVAEEKVAEQKVAEEDVSEENVAEEKATEEKVAKKKVVEEKAADGGRIEKAEVEVENVNVPERTSVEAGKEERVKKLADASESADQLPCERTEHPTDKSTEKFGEKREGNAEENPSVQSEDEPENTSEVETDKTSEDKPEQQSAFEELPNTSETEEKAEEKTPEGKPEQIPALKENHVNSQTSATLSQQPVVSSSSADNSSSAETKSPESTDSAPVETIRVDNPESVEAIKPNDQPAPEPVAQNLAVADAELPPAAGTQKTESNAPEPDTEQVAAATSAVAVVVAQPKQVPASPDPVTIEESYAASEEDLWGPGSEPV